MSCDLCGLDTRRNPVERQYDGSPRVFCCLGCMNVYTILLESGILQPGIDPRETDLFRRSRELGLISTGREEAAKPRAVPDNAPLEEKLFHVSGMWCSSCAWLIEHSLTRDTAVRGCEVLFASDLVKVRFCPQYLPPDRIVSRIEQLGYRASEYSAESLSTGREAKDLLLRVGVAAFLWINVMMLNLAVYIGYFESTPASIRAILPFAAMGLAAVSIAWCAQPVLRLAWRGLLAGTLRMETLLALGIFGAFGYSTVEAFRGGSHVYFDISCAIVALVLAGKLLERGAKDNTARAITGMYRMLPSKARLLAGGRERFVSIEALEPGSIFVVKAGERIPADGIVTEGTSHADESLLTGEALPVSKSTGSRVVCGSVNGDGVLHVQATTVGESSTLAQILRTVERALSTKSPLEKAVDRVSRWFVPAVVALAAATFLGWRYAGHAAPGDALMRAVTVLVIACPCALGIATPLAITAAVGAASRHGILVGDSRVLETIGKVDSVALDKTGTVTEGNFALLECDPRDLAALASLEAYSEHPLGRAVVEHAGRSGIVLAAAESVEIHKGAGVAGTVAGQRWTIGNGKLFASIPATLAAAAGNWQGKGATVAFYGTDGAARGILVFGDRVKPGTSELVAELKRRGIRVVLLSGDSRATTAWVAGQIGCDEFHAEARPEEKARIIAAMQQGGRVVAMVGDGINDAPALAQADLGMALSTGAEIAMRAAAVVLMSRSLEKVTETFELSRRTLRVVRQNLFWAFFYNIVGISFAMAGLLNPIVAAGAMVVSSASVVWNSFRLARGYSRKAAAAEGHSPKGSQLPIGMTG